MNGLINVPVLQVNPFFEFFSSSVTEIQKVFLSTSTKSTLAPKYSAQLAEATKVIAEVSTFDFEFIPKAKQDVKRLP